MRHDYNRDLSIGTYVLLGGVAVSIEAVGFTMTALGLAGFICVFLLLSLVAATVSYFRGQSCKTGKKTASSTCPAQMGGAKASITL